MTSRRHDFSKQMRVALEFMLCRTELALKHLAKSEFDAAMHLLTLRKAAFHNFRIADDLISYRDPLLYQELRVLWGKISVVDQKLNEELEKYKSELGQDLTKIKKELRAISRFRSQQGPESEISLSV